MGEIEEFAEEHRVGAGFTDMYIREESSYDTKELALKSEQLEEILFFLPSYDRVETGYSDYREELKFTFARGEGMEQNVFWSEQYGLVNAIWLDLWITPETKEMWHSILTALGKSGACVVG